MDYYEDLCKLDLYNHSLINRFPFAIKDEATFTQHQIVLYYKQNYCNNIRVLSDREPNKRSGGQDYDHDQDTQSNDISYEFISYDHSL